MAKVRFYCDVPEYRSNGYPLYATTTQPGYSPMVGAKRVAFDVDLPPELWKAFDVPAPMATACVVAGEEECSG